MCNLLEYGLGLDPLTWNFAYPKVKYVKINGLTFMDLTYPRNLAATDTALVLEFTNNMSSWSPLTRVLTMEPANEDASVYWVTERTMFPTDNMKTGFFRLRLVQVR